jgi:hypothetical protein
MGEGPAVSRILEDICQTAGKRHRQAQWRGEGRRPVPGPSTCFQQFLSRAGNSRKAHSHQRKDEKHPYSGNLDRTYVSTSTSRPREQHSGVPDSERGGEIVSLVLRHGPSESTLANGVKGPKGGRSAVSRRHGLGEEYCR